MPQSACPISAGSALCSLQVAGVATEFVEAMVRCAGVAEGKRVQSIAYQGVSNSQRTLGSTPQAAQQHAFAAAYSSNAKRLWVTLWYKQQSGTAPGSADCEGGGLCEQSDAAEPSRLCFRKPPHLASMHPSWFIADRDTETGGGGEDVHSSPERRGGGAGGALGGTFLEGRPSFNAFLTHKDRTKLHKTPLTVKQCRQIAAIVSDAVERKGTQRGWVGMVKFPTCCRG